MAAGRAGHTGPVSLSDLRTARGVIRLLNTSGGGVLCLAGEVDAAAVTDFVRRYGREPARVAAIDAGSVTALSPSAREILLDHLEREPRLLGPVHCCPPAAARSRSAASSVTRAARSRSSVVVAVP